MEIKNKYKRSWYNINEHQKVKPKDLGHLNFERYFEYLPKRIFLNQSEEELFEILKEKRRFDTDEFLVLLSLNYKIGLHPEGFEAIQRRLKKLLRESQKNGVNLPKSFLNFFSNYDYLARFRTHDLSFFPDEKLKPFPEDTNYFIVPFFGDSQGFCFWNLLIDKDGEYCILYSDMHWQEMTADYEYLICADSFEEFITRLSHDLKTAEGESPELKFIKRLPFQLNLSTEDHLERLKNQGFKSRKNTQNDVKYADLIENGVVKNLQEYLSIFDWLLQFDLVDECSTDKEKVEQLLKIKKLELPYQKIKSIPESIGKLHNLWKLDFSRCHLTKIPASIGNLKNLRSLSLGGNQLTQLPEEIGDLLNLGYLYLSDNQIKELPEEIGNLSNLEYLSLSYNQIKELSKSFCKLTNLEELLLNNNHLEKLPDEIGNLKKLKFLNISSNKIAYLPENYQHLKILEELSIADNLLNILPTGFLKLKNLRAFNFQQNHFQKFPDELLNLKSLKRIDFDKKLVTNDEFEVIKKHFGKSVSIVLHADEN